ncbi:hypothetical protein [Ammoniphilus sp. YIM 78166]|uniref:sunset domain-containing protein n=1 Tax=Ammoniphilus sp. YIM 78166 TaxID=1644106 RepID=UPI00196AC01B
MKHRLIALITTILLASFYGLAFADHGKINAHPYSYCNGQIKGNISNSGEKIYHVPGGQYYKQTKAEYCFKTIEQAKKAGFRASKR